MSTKLSFANTIQNVLTLVAATLMLQVIPLVEDVYLGSRAFAQHVCLWRHEDGWLHALLYAAMNSELELAMWLCKLYRTILSFRWINVVMIDPCFMIFQS